MQKHVLFLDKVFLRGRTHDKLRGVEKFNLALLKDLNDFGIEVTVVAAKSWHKALSETNSKGNLRIISVLEFGEAWMKALLAIPKLYGKRFDLLFLANVGNGIVPAVRLMYALKLFPSCTLLAHREASSYFVRQFKKIPCKVVSVNSQIAKPFSEANFPVSDVYYGITNSTRFKQKQHSEKDEINFAVFGNLDSPWKGVDTAVSAFKKLPAEIHKKSTLHLAGFSDKLPNFDDTKIKVYNWLEDNQVVEFLNSMDVMIVPSRDTNEMKETFSQSMVQGMISGLPLLVNDLPILTEKVDEGGGLIFKTEAELTEKMVDLATSHELRAELGAKAHRTALERYNWSTRYFVEKYF